MMRIVACVVAGLVAALQLSPAAARTDKRVALVIGNSAYEHTAPLRNPVNDARRMSESLKSLGFEVIDGFDLNQSGMREKIRAFSRAIDGASVALFYYAGHGLQVAGNNHLAPVNARLEQENDLDFETVSLNLVLRQMERERRTNIVFLDACRDNPLARRLARSLSSTRSTAVASGLAAVESGVGMLIGYSTSPGEVALDGDGDNSPYTSALLKHIDKPGQDIHSMMIAVRQDVLAESNGKQLPWEHSSLTGQFYFNPAPAQVAAVPPAPAPEPPQVPRDAGAQAVVTAYQATVAIGTCGAYRLFEEQHRGTFYGRLAEEWLRANCPAVDRAATPAPSPAPPSAAIDAGARLAAVDPSAAAPAAPAEPAQAPAPPSGRDLVVALQRNLDRVGCAPGPVDGQWGARSRQALERFGTFAKLDLETDAPSAAALAAVEGQKGRVCPLDRSCGAGEILAADGSCVARVVPAAPAAPKPSAAPKPAPPPQTAKPAQPAPQQRRAATPPAAQPAPAKPKASGVCINIRGFVVPCDAPDVHLRM